MSDYKLTVMPIITVEHLGENRITQNNLPLVSKEGKARLIKYTLKEGNIVFSRVGPPALHSKLFTTALQGTCFYPPSIKLRNVYGAFTTQS